MTVFFRCGKDKVQQDFFPCALNSHTVKRRFLYRSGILFRLLFLIICEVCIESIMMKKFDHKTTVNLLKGSE